MPELRGLILLIVFLIICGVSWMFLRDRIAEPFRTIIIVVFVIALALYALRLFGLF